MDRNTWVLVANGEKARIFEVEKFGKLNEIYTMIHPEAKLSQQELTRDDLGRSTDVVRKTANGYEPETMPKEKKAVSFAKEVAKYLDACRNSCKFSHIFIMADPHFLGLLRGSMGKNTAGTIEGQVSKDLTKFPSEKIWAHLPVVN